MNYDTALIMVGLEKNCTAQMRKSGYLCVNIREIMEKLMVMPST